MNRRLSGDVSLNAPILEDDSGMWQDSLVDDAPNQEWILAKSQEVASRRKALAKAAVRRSDSGAHSVSIDATADAA
jgi:RNA polymerase sigma-32 factor